MLDLILAIAHHLLVFSVAGCLAAETALFRAPMRGGTLRRLGSIDRAYGILAGLVVAIGFLRVYLGAKGPDFYLGNPFFWAKIAAFLAVGVISIGPTMRLIGWQRAAKADLSFVPPLAEVKRVRRWVRIEVGVFLLIPVFAAVMARGYGL